MNFCPHCGIDEPGDKVSCRFCGEQMLPAELPELHDREQISIQEGKCFICGISFGSLVLKNHELVEIRSYPTKWNFQICSLCWMCSEPTDTLTYLIWKILEKRISDPIARSVNCQQCGKLFSTVKKSQKFCSGKCRIFFHKEENKDDTKTLS